VTLENGRRELIAALNTKPLRISYLHLVGTGMSNRAAAPCDAIVQAAVHGQGTKQYTDNWTADGFVRWAHCLGFVKYDYASDAFSITDSGLRLSSLYEEGEELSKEEQKILVDAILSYPPAIRVLTLLSQESAHLTKFEIGKQLGFTGEGGFTSMPQALFVRSLATNSDNEEKNKMRNDWEGSSDKYARMIASWLIKLGLVQKVAKRVTVTVGDEEYTENIGQAFVITAQGLTALHRAKGESRHKRIPKTICFEMLATKGKDRDFLRTRRGLIIKMLNDRKAIVTAKELVAYLANYNIETTEEAVCDDIYGFKNIGIDIDVDSKGFTWCDKINDFVIPIRSNRTPAELELVRKKDNLRKRITHVSHDYLSLLDLAFDGKQSRLFEMKTLQLLVEECGYCGLHLGGSRKPDGIIYTDSCSRNYGVIIDTKAYSNSYTLPIQQADEMQRYVQENQCRDQRENPNKWWEYFSKDVMRFYFMFVAGKFDGKYEDQINRIVRITNTKGTAIEIDQLLIIADEIKCNIHSLAQAEKRFFS